MRVSRLFGVFGLRPGVSISLAARPSFGTHAEIAETRAKINFNNQNDIIGIVGQVHKPTLRIDTGH
jgi:hypothetical protein